MVDDLRQLANELRGTAFAFQCFANPPPVAIEMTIELLQRAAAALEKVGNDDVKAPV